MFIAEAFHLHLHQPPNWERLAKSVEQLTQAAGEYSLDLGLARNEEVAKPLKELSRHHVNEESLLYHRSTVSRISTSSAQVLRSDQNTGLLMMGGELRSR